MGIALACLAAALGLWARSGPCALDWVRAGLPLAGAAEHLVSLAWLSPAIRAIRDAGEGSIANLPAGDPRIELFGELHLLSNALFIAAVLIALGSASWDLAARPRNPVAEPTRYGKNV